MKPDRFNWKLRPESEIQRLAKLLQKYLDKDGVALQSRRMAFCRQEVRRILGEQKNSCIFAGGDDRYCWNNPREDKKGVVYLKLQWAHLVPLSHGALANRQRLSLMCARCNNHIQTSRALHQLVVELEHKLPVIRAVLAQQTVQRDGR
jgi:hypothetical protein